MCLRHVKRNAYHIAREHREAYIAFAKQIYRIERSEIYRASRRRVLRKEKKDMRNLTILREKSFVGSLAKMKVYIEDPASIELTISGTPCRKLGDLKNGERQTFEIEEDARRIYVIADTVSKEYCNEVYELPAGAEDISLSGRNCYEPSRGNAFRFADNNSESALQQRKRGKKIGWIVLICAILVGFAVGFVISYHGAAPKEKTFTDKGMSITLMSDFVPFEGEGFQLCYGSSDEAVFVIKEPFSTLEGLETFTLDQYTELVISANQLDTKMQHTASGIPYYDYQGTNEGETFDFRAYTYRTGDAFWIVQFTSKVENIESMYAQFDAWADTVTFTDGQ